MFIRRYSFYSQHYFSLFSCIIHILALFLRKNHLCAVYDTKNQMGRRVLVAAHTVVSAQTCWGETHLLERNGQPGTRTAHTATHTLRKNVPPQKIGHAPHRTAVEQLW